MPRLLVFRRERDIVRKIAQIYRALLEAGRDLELLRSGRPVSVLIRMKPYGRRYSLKRRVPSYRIQCEHLLSRLRRIRDWVEALH